jgi:hypothetical protein
MKKLSLLLAMLAVVLAFGLAFVSCDNDTTSSNSGGGGGGGGGGASILTITDIPSSYNGKYIAFFGAIGNTEFLLGCESVNTSNPDNMTARLVQISNGRANLPMWRASQVTSQGYTGFVRYNGNGTASSDESGFAIFNYRDVGFSGDDDQVAAIVFSSGITFSNGGATVSASNGTVMSW